MWRAYSEEFTKEQAKQPYDYHAAISGFATIRLPGMSLDRDEQRDLGTLWLDVAVSMTVRVRNYRDEPLAGAEEVGRIGTVDVNQLRLMASRDEANASVLRRARGEGQPGRDRLRRIEPPIGRVLMPGDMAFAARGLVDETGGDAIQVRAEKIFHDVDDPRLVDQSP